jgi:hypothetical protein
MVFVERGKVIGLCQHKDYSWVPLYHPRCRSWLTGESNRINGETRTSVLSWSRGESTACLHKSSNSPILEESSRTSPTRPVSGNLDSSHRADGRDNTLGMTFPAWGDSCWMRFEPKFRENSDAIWYAMEISEDSSRNAICSDVETWRRSQDQKNPMW